MLDTVENEQYKNQQNGCRGGTGIKRIKGHVAPHNNALAGIRKPDLEAAQRIYIASKPDATEIEITAWIDILHSQIFLYIMAKEALEIMRGEGAMDSKFYQGVARVVARAMILELELPLPRDLQ